MTSSEEWKRIPEKTESQRIAFRTIVTKYFELPNGEILDFGTLNAEGANDAAVIPLTRDNKVVVSRLFRPGPEMVMEEIPGGFVDEGESVVSAAIREVEEETGFIPSEDSEIIDLGAIPQQDAYSNSTKNYFLITNMILGKAQKLEAEETIVKDEISIERLISNALEGRMTDGMAVFKALDRLREIQGRELNEKTN